MTTKRPIQTEMQSSNTSQAKKRKNKMQVTTSKVEQSPVVEVEEILNVEMVEEIPKVEVVEVDETSKVEVDETSKVELEETPKVEKKQKKQKKQKMKIKKRIIRYPSGYLMFTLMHRKIVHEKNPTMRLGDISKQCGLAWKDISNEEKIKWKIEADNEKIRRQSLEVHVSTETSETPVVKQKRVPSSYLLFAMNERVSITAENPTIRVGDCSKLCGVKWHALTLDEKKVWTQRSNQLKLEADKSTMDHSTQ